MQKKARFVLFACLFLASLGGAGYVQGVWTHRWAVTNVDSEMSHLDRVPLVVGAWQGKNTDRREDRETLADAQHVLTRRYVNQKDGAICVTSLSRGRPGPMVIKHLPTECYPSAGFDMVKGPKRYLSTNPGSEAVDEFWVATFKKIRAVPPVTLRVYWSWSATGQWRVPDRPRVDFARYSTLYKLYVQQEINDEDEPFDGAAAHDLIQQMTKAMRESFF